MEIRPVPKNMPVWSLISGVVLILVLGALILLLPTEKMSSTQVGTLVAIIATTVPSLFAAAYAERTSRDIRNGTVVEKVREGTTQAIEESGVLTQSGPVANASIEATAHTVTALTKLLTQTSALSDLLTPTAEHPSTETEVNDHG